MGGWTRRARWTGSGGSRCRTTLFACVALLALLTVACATDDGGGGGDADAAPTSTTEGADPTPSEPAPRPSAGCDAGAAAPVVEEERTLTVGGADRRYLLSMPQAHDGTAPLPVVFDFHGFMEGAEVHALMTQYSALAEEAGFVAVFPHGTGDPVGWDTSSDAATNADVAYFDAVLEQVAAEVCIDEARVYATGLSMGAMFTSLLVCHRADVLAAAAPVAGITHDEGCAPDRSVPVVSFHGTADRILLFNGGVDVSAIPGFGQPDDAPTTTAAPVDLDGEGYPANVAAFAAHNGCDPDPEDTELTAELIHRVYQCPPGADVELYIVVGGGHTWPSSELSRSISEIVGTTTFDVDATRDAWEFMRRFTNL
jgi:polyhydroxybutyrate depolymerase